MKLPNPLILQSPVSWQSASKSKWFILSFENLFLFQIVESVTLAPKSFKLKQKIVSGLFRGDLVMRPLRTQ